MALLMVGIVITPDSKFYSLHTAFGTTLFLFQFIFSIYITVLKLSPENIALLLEFVAGLASLFFFTSPRWLFTSFPNTIPNWLQFAINLQPK
jgi:hypothetical protein